MLKKINLCGTEVKTQEWEIAPNVNIMRNYEEIWEMAHTDSTQKSISFKLQTNAKI